MDLGTLVQKVYEVITAFRNGDYVTSLVITLEIIKALAVVFPTSAFPVQSSTLDGKSLDELVNDLEDCCKRNPVTATADAGSSAFILLVLPILVEVGKKLLAKWFK